MRTPWFREAVKRGVLQILGVYAGATWALVQILDWAAGRYGFPATFSDLAFIFFAAMVPTVIRLTWLRGEGQPAGVGHRERLFPAVFVGLNLLLAAALAGLLFGGMSTDGEAKAGPPTREQLTYMGNVHEPVISPDGEAFVYHVLEPDGTERLMLRTVAAGEARELMKAWNFGSTEWTSSGEEILAIEMFPESAQRPPRVLLVPISGGTPREIATNVYASASADGRRIVHSGGGPARAIYISEPATGETTPVPLAGEFEFIGWSVMSPSGDLVAVTTRTGPLFQLWSVPANGGSQYKLSDDSVAIGMFRWSPDGMALLYTRDTELHRIRIDPATGAPLEPAPGEATGFDIPGRWFDLSRDGRRVVYVETSSRSNLWLVRADQAPVQLTTGTSMKDWPIISPNGQTLAYHDRAGDGEIRFMSLEERQARPVPGTQNSVVRSMVWSPDGSQILYSRSEGGEMIVATADLAGQVEPLPVTEVSASTGLAWCGSAVLYQKTGNRNFGVLYPATAAETPLVRDPQLGWIFYPKCAPDGKSIAVYWNRTDGQRGIWIIAGDAHRRIYAGNHMLIGWSADGEWIYFVPRNTSSIWRVSPNGVAEEVLRLPWSPPEFSLGTMTPDGSAFVFSVRDSESDIWMIDNFDPAATVAR